MIAGTLRMGRSQAQARMTETFQFFTTATVTDEDTLVDTVTETVVDTSIGRVKFPNAQARDVESANQHPVVQRVEVHVPSAPYSPSAPSPWLLPGGDVLPAVHVGVGVFVRIVDSSVDLSLIGRVFRVAELPAGGQVTATRYKVEEVN